MPGIGSRWRTLPPWVRDGVLAAGLTIAGQLELLALADEVSGPRPLQHLAFAVMTGCLVIRRVRPLTAAVASALGLAFQTLLGEAPAVSGFAAVLIAVYSVAQYADRRRDAVVGLAAILAAVEVYPFVADDVRFADEVGNAVIPLVVWVFARLARERLDRAIRAEREAAAARARMREDELERAAALAAERRRIAREMHDVVGHGVTLMLLHADAAQASLAGREPATAEALDVVLAAGRAALADLQRTLRVLRESNAEGDQVGEQPGTLAQIEELAASAARAGRDVAVRVEGELRPLPSAVEATAYRIVQESLTNALKHAPGARIRVRLVLGTDTLEVDVTDDGPGHGRDGGRPGFGLAGIRERAALFDGRVSAGPRDEGPGWRTRVVLPVPAREPAAA
ncbi:sensor histidine kinase [Blastococcus sp. SYSU DS0617]